MNNVKEDYDMFLDDVMRCQESGKHEELSEFEQSDHCSEKEFCPEHGSEYDQLYKPIKELLT